MLIAEEVLRHVSTSNELAADTVRAAVLRERHKTSMRLRKYYMMCLAELLEDDGRCVCHVIPRM